MTKVQLSNTELVEQFARQKSRLEKSFKSYFEGNLNESIEIATVLRILLHDKGTNKPLLFNILKTNNLKFLDTSTNLNPTILPNGVSIQMNKWGLVLTRFGSNGEFIPKCEVPLREKGTYIDFDIWWNKIIITDGKEIKISRKEIILYLAEQDGGVHVDPSIDEKYYNITRNNSTTLEYKLKIDGINTSFKSIELASVCEIAYEVLETLKTNNL